MAHLSTWRARAPLPAPAFCAVSALTVVPMELGTMNKKLIIFSTRPTSVTVMM